MSGRHKMVAALADICLSRILKGPQVVADRDDREQHDDQHEKSNDRQASFVPSAMLQSRPQADARQSEHRPSEIQKGLHSLGPILHDTVGEGSQWTASVIGSVFRK